MNDLLWLGEPGCDRPAIVGGKAANLGRLMAIHPVPPGFCITASAHARRASTGDQLPEPLRSLVQSAYAALGERLGAESPRVAVRSSAVDEDGAGASFAGLYVTCLNVRGIESVLLAIARCWASAEDPRVKSYRERRGLPDAGVGVLVQELIAADTAAVVFSANPTTGAADEIVINANYGLGESIVGGIATPDTWILRKPEPITSRFHLGTKESMTVLSEDGTRPVPVLRTLRARPSLDEAQVLQLAHLALHLEKIMGWPVDIECAYRGNKLYLLQCRPITTGKAS